MYFNRTSRRFFLRGAGAALALPLLPSLLRSSARAELTTTQKSFIGIGAWNGLFRMYGPESILMPPMAEKDKKLVSCNQLELPGRHTIHHAQLTELAAQNGGKISDLIDASYTPYLNKMLMLQGFDYIGLGSFHHEGQFGNWHKASGSEGNPDMATLDVVLADWFAKVGLVGDLVTYSPQSKDKYGPSSRADGTLPTRYYNPATLWDKYFGNASIPPNLKELLVDRVLEDYKALKSNPRLGSEDRQRLEAHIDHLAVTEAKVKQYSAVCQQLRPDDSLTDRSQILRTMNDVIVGLISCGLCHSFLGWAKALVSDKTDQWHVWSHEGFNNDDDLIANQSSYDQLVEQNRSVLKDMCLDLVQKLDQLGQLDNCLIVWIQEHSKRGHESWNVPAIAFGSAGGALATGRYVDYRNIARRDDKQFTRFGFPLNQLYATVLRAMGMPVAEFEALNKSRSDGATSPFKPGSGYGINAIHPNASQMAKAYEGWTGQDLSEWLPMLEA